MVSSVLLAAASIPSLGGATKSGKVVSHERGNDAMLANRSALITGSLGAIGFATAKVLAGLGCDITLNGFAAPEVIEARLFELRTLGVRARYDGADLRQPPQIAELIETAQHAHGVWTFW
jgi:NAD(P)-dependent dehydrogenase (short-subunit alcohol dehydrogenase family)